MKNISYFVIIVLAAFAAGCQKGPYPYITSQEAKKIDSAVHPAITNAALIYQNDIYYIADFDKPLVRITSDGAQKKFVKMSHDHTKFAYQDAIGVINIVDSKGNNLAYLSQYSAVKSFDWSVDDKTLYILNGSSMAYYGPNMNLPVFAYPGITNGSTIEVLSASVSLSGDFAYVVHGYNFFDGDKYELIIQPANNGKLIEYDDPEDDVATMDYVNFSFNKQDLVVGYRESDSQSKAQQSLKFFTGLKSTPDATYMGGNSATPVYNSTLNYLVAGFIDVNNNNAIEPAALYIGQSSVLQDANVAETKYLSKYSISSGDLYMDWK